MGETAASASEKPGASGADKRRSTRVVRAVPIIVVGTDALGQTFRESTATTVVDCYGCKFQSQNYVPKNSAVMVEIFHAPGWDRRVIRGRVVWLQRPRTHREKYQIAIEMDVPGNVWGVAPPPSDWFPHPDDIAQTPIEVLDPVAAGAADDDGAEEIETGDSKGSVADAGPLEANSPGDEAAGEQTEQYPAEPEEITFTREQLDGELRETIGKTLRSLVEKAAEGAVRDLVQDVTDRSSEIVEVARRISQETAEEVDAKLRTALDEAVRSMNIEIPKSLTPKQRRRKGSRRDD